MFILARYSYRNLWVRRLTTLMTMGGMALVVFVFAAVLMLALGFEKTLVTTGDKDNVVFIRRSSETEVQSIIEREEAAILETQPEIAAAADGRRFAAREVMVLISLNRRSDNGPANIAVRGVDARNSLVLRPQLRISAGRSFTPGTAELVVGKSIARRFATGGLGETITFGTRTWTIVGVMESDGNGFE
jgi:putative ABC transport system permease protein